MISCSFPHVMSRRDAIEAHCGRKRNSVNAELVSFSPWSIARLEALPDQGSRLPMLPIARAGHTTCCPKCHHVKPRHTSLAGRKY